MITNPRPSYDELRVWGELAYVSPDERDKILNLPQHLRHQQRENLKREIATMKAKLDRGYL